MSNGEVPKLMQSIQSRLPVSSALAPLHTQFRSYEASALTIPDPVPEIGRIRDKPKRVERSRNPNPTVNLILFSCLEIRDARSDYNCAPCGVAKNR